MGWIFTGGRTVHTSLLTLTDKARVWRARCRRWPLTCCACRQRSGLQVLGSSINPKSNLQARVWCARVRQVERVRRAQEALAMSNVQRLQAAQAAAHALNPALGQPLHV